MTDRLGEALAWWHDKQDFVNVTSSQSQRVDTLAEAAQWKRDFPTDAQVARVHTELVIMFGRATREQAKRVVASLGGQGDTQ